ncbi:MAG: M14 family metallocarboxypeptidase [Verrucomicrobiota bacterium]|nr:M14 family metallocarboxypeptidase [Verrucomicrobiota bacterium]
MTEPLGRNIGGYGGDTIDIDDVLQRALAAAEAHGWLIERFPSAGDQPLYGFQRLAKRERLSVYISTGIHGDEPGGPLAMLELLEANAWPSGVSLFACPCLNPTGFPGNTRENKTGTDLNRDYRDIKSREVQAHTEWIDSLPKFDFGICLHEDWEAKGFYVYELNPDNLPAVSEDVIDAVGQACPIDRSERIDDRPAKGGILKPIVSPDARPLWPEAFYIVLKKTGLSYTVEAPSDFPMPTRVNALCTAVQTLIESHLAKR